MLLVRALRTKYYSINLKWQWFIKFVSLWKGHGFVELSFCLHLCLVSKCIIETSFRRQTLSEHFSMAPSLIYYLHLSWARKKGMSNRHPKDSLNLFTQCIHLYVFTSVTIYYVLCILLGTEQKWKMSHITPSVGELRGVGKLLCKQAMGMQHDPVCSLSPKET